MVYFIISNTLLLVFFLIYHFRLRKLTFYSWNRWYILGSIVLAFSLPFLLFVDYQLPKMIAIHLPSLELNNFNVSNLVSTDRQVLSWNFYDYAMLIYWTGVLFSILILLVKILFLFRSKKRFSGFESYSFFGNIKLGALVEDNQTIRIHEEIHVKNGHSYDLLFIEIIQLFNWFNPLFYFVKRALKLVHECQVDAHFSDNKVEYAELLIAHAFQVDAATLRQDFSRKSMLKKRIQMLFKNASVPLSRINYLAILPISLLAVLLIKNSQAHTMQNFIPHQNLSSRAMADDVKKRKEIYSYQEIDQPPVYPGGLNEFRKMVYNNFVYPEQAKQAKVKGNIEISFVISNKGTVQDFEIINDLGHGTGQNAIQALKQSKLWKPAVKNGHPVGIRYILPLRLDLSQEESKSL